MVELSAEQIAQRAFDLNLLDERQMQAVWSHLGTRSVEAAELTQVLLQKELLTNYQLDRLIKGERTGYFYGHHKVLYYCGAGTFARVYRALNLKNKELVAIKVLRKRFNDNLEERNKFLREAEVGQSLRHPNIVAIFEVHSDKHASYMVMEFVEGRTLRDFLKVRGKFEWQEATRLAADLASGLDYAFQRGISHRDLKASNILLSANGRAKVVDFGLAGADPNLSDEALADLDNPRTIDYAALERSTGVKKDDSRSDVYFLGCIYYHMLSGVPPLSDTKDRMQRLSKTRFTDILPLTQVAPHVPHAVAAVAAKAMEMNPDLRYQNPGQMLADLRVAEKAPDVVPPLASATAIGGPKVVLGPQQSVMVIDSSTQMQDALRDQLKKSGFRVLVTRDPQRALNVGSEHEKPADCVLFSTASLGETALKAFNQFGHNEFTKSVPAILLLGAKHQGWKSHAQLAPHRVILNAPLKMKDLLDLLAKLLSQVTASGTR